MQERLSREAARLRAAHAQALARNNALVDAAVKKLSAGSDASFGDQREELALLVATTYRPVEAALNALEADTGHWDVQARGALAQARAAATTQAGAVHEELRTMQAASDAAQANLTAEVGALKTRVAAWKAAAQREATEVGGSEDEHAAAFKRALQRGKEGVTAELTGLQRRFEARLESLGDALTETGEALSNAKTKIVNQHRVDYAAIRSDGKTGAAALLAAAKKQVASSVGGASKEEEAPIVARREEVKKARGAVDALSAELTRRARAAAREEARGNSAQEAKLNALEASLTRERRQGDSALAALESDVARTEARNDRNKDAAERAQAAAIAAQSLALQRAVRGLASQNVAGATALSQYKQAADAKLGALRRFLASAVAGHKASLRQVDAQALARLQQIAAGLTQAGTQLAATERQDERWAGELAARKAEKLAWLHARMQQIEQWRKQKVDDYDGAIAEDYAATRARLEQVVEAAEAALNGQLKGAARTTGARMGTLTSSVASELTRIDARIAALAKKNEDNHAWLAAQVQRVAHDVGQTAALERQVREGVGAAKEAVRVLARNISLANAASSTQLEQLQNEVAPNAGLASQVSEMQRAVRTVQRLVDELRDRVGEHATELDASAAHASEGAHRTRAFLSHELARLRALLAGSKDKRTQARTAREAAVHAWDERLGRWNETLAKTVPFPPATPFLTITHP